MRIENGYLQQSMLCSKNNRNAVGNFSDTMNKAQECISNKISTRDSYVNSTDYSNFGIYTEIVYFDGKKIILYDYNEHKIESTPDQDE